MGEGGWSVMLYCGSTKVIKSISAAGSFFVFFTLHFFCRRSAEPSEDENSQIVTMTESTSCWSEMKRHMADDFFNRPYLLPTPVYLFSVVGFQLFAFFYFPVPISYDFAWRRLSCLIAFLLGGIMCGWSFYVMRKHQV